MKVWVLTYDDCCELNGVFTSREKAREALKERIERSEDLSDLRLCDEPYEDFEYYHFKSGYKIIEAIIQECELDKVY